CEDRSPRSALGGGLWPTPVGTPIRRTHPPCSSSTVSAGPATGGRPLPPPRPPSPQQLPYQPTQAIPRVPQDWQPQPAPVAPQPPRRSRKKVLIGAGIVVVLAAAGLAAWQLTSGDDKPALTYQGK